MVKIPGIESNRWAPNFSWDRLLSLWHNSGIGGLIIPVSLNDQLSGLFDQVQTLIGKIRDREMESWLIFPVLNNSVFYFRHPESHPVHRTGEDFSFPGWFAPICPTDDQYRSFLGDVIARSLVNLPAHAVILDYARTPYFWEEWGNVIDPHQWPPFCYCERCRLKFEADTNINFGAAKPADWRKWQGEIISGWLAEISGQIQKLFKKTQVGVQLLPLVSDDGNEMCSEWLGQDVHLLQKNAHFFSPLIYEKLLDWHHDDSIAYLVELLKRQKLPVIPSFQVSSIKWDRRKESGDSLPALIERIQPLGIHSATLFHARSLLNEKSIRSILG
ncbi:MAG TPA: hypothetical protein ENH29_07385 [Bacteroidetes bacterium]|nr:hypothetical protein [Bacteroidota bacterium]